MWLLPFLLLAAEAWALGLGDIRLSSALNQPLRAEIELLSATPEELTNLRIQLASAETFARYDLDRPLFLTRIDFEVVSSGRSDGNFIRVTSTEPISEPFVTFLVEASWSRGRLLREYTLLLDPPTFVPPPATQSTQAVTAPSRATPADSGQIERPAPAPQPQATAPQASRPAVQTPVQSQPTPAPAPQNSGQNTGQPGFDTAPGGDLVVRRGDTLWGITSRVRPDSRLTINQTMLAIYEANPEAFAGNINVLRAGATLRIPSADDVFRISRGDAFAEVQRQNEAWSGGTSAETTSAAPDPIAPVDTQPSLTLVPPDEEDDVGLIDAAPDTVVDDTQADDAAADFDPVESRINEIQAILDDQDALIEIPDNELAALRAELAELRGDPLPDSTADDLVIEAADEPAVDDAATDAPVDATPEAADPVPPAVVSAPAQEQGLVDTILGYFTNFFVIIGVALVAAVLLLVWFMRRAANRDDEEATGVWDALDADEFDPQSKTSTERLQALARDDDESIVVVETQQVDNSEFSGDTLETPAAFAPGAGEETEAPLDMPQPDAEPITSVGSDASAATGTNKSLEDTFSSETAINLDQSDPIAEADFHMAYGLYDQAADLINGALTTEPERQDLLAKLCEIYFVWGNRDAFIDAATRMKGLAGSGDNSDWDKTVIMGQQIAGDHELFSGVSAEGATKAVDLSFDDGADDGGVLDIDFAGEADDSSSDIIDLGDDTGQVMISPDEGSAIDFSLGDEEPDLEASVTREMPTSPSGDDTVDAAYDEGTAEMPTPDDSASTVETPTIEQQFAMDATGELPAANEAEAEAALPESEATAEINLDDLGLDLGGLDDPSGVTDVVGEDLIGDLDDTTESQSLQIPDDLAETGKNTAVDAESLIATGTNEALDALDAVGIDPESDADQTDVQEALSDDETLAATGEMPSLSEATGMMPALGDDDATMLASLDDDAADTDVGIDTSLLDATGQTQILPDDMAVDTGINKALEIGANDATLLASGDDDAGDAAAIADDAATLLAPLDDDDDGEFDFAKTEALPKDVFSSDMSTDETGRMPAMTGETDVDLDLDDLTAALKVSEVGDTVNQLRDDATVEQPRITPDDATSETSVTQALAPDDLTGDLHEARTMTEVGTKLDLARAYVDMGDPAGARSILEEVLDEGDAGQKQQAQQLLDSLPA